MDRLKVGVLGLRRGITHFRNFLHLENCVVVGAADRLSARRERAAEVAGDADVAIVEEFDQLLEMQPDAIIVASNGKLQVEHCCQVMEAGCHVMSEVPGADTEDELIRLRDCVETTGRTYMFGENTCFFDFIRYWRKWVVEGRLGEVSLAEAEYLHYLPNTLTTPDGTVMPPSRARAEGHTDAVPVWRADQPPIQYLTHDLGPVLEILDDRVVNVSCKSGPWRCIETPLRSDGQFALFETAKGSLIRILVTLSTRRPGEHRYRLFGTEGSAEWFNYEGYCRLFDRDREEKDGWQKVDIGVAARDDDTSTGHGGTDLKLARCFAETILEGKPSPLDVYRAIEYCLPGIIANKSAKLGGAPLPIPDLRRTPYETTRLWDAVGLPEVDPSSDE